jgi:hypothetical protein
MIPKIEYDCNIIIEELDNLISLIETGRYSKKEFKEKIFNMKIYYESIEKQLLKLYYAK